MSDALLFLILTGLAAFACGVGPFLWIWPAPLRHRGIDLQGVLMTGFGMMALSAVYFVIGGGGTRWAVPAALLVSLGAAVTRWFRDSQDVRDQFAGMASSLARGWGVWAAGAALGAILVFPGVYPQPGQPGRIGPDQVGYGIFSQYLLDGGTRGDANRQIMERTGEPTLERALDRHQAVLCFNFNVAPNFMRAMRIGYPGMMASLSRFFGWPLLYPHLFLFLFWPSVFLVAVLWLFFHHAIGAGEAPALLYALAVALNCNLLNNACEGQHAQWFAAPYIGLLFLALYLHRGGSGAPVDGVLRLAAALSAFVVAFYSDVYLALILVGVAMAAGDFLLGSRDLLRRDGSYGAAVGAGMLATGPFFLQWIPFIILHSERASSGQAGFPQPFWANPAEIMGWFDIYARPIDQVLYRPWLVAAGGLILSLLAVQAVALFLLAPERRQAAYWLAPVLFAGLIFFKFDILKGGHNYVYMKAYTVLYFPLMTCFYAAMPRLSAWLRDAWAAPRWATRLPSLVAVAAAAASIATGWHYLGRYRDQERKLPPGIMALRDYHLQHDLERAVILTYPHLTILESSLSLFFPLNWLNYRADDAYLLVAAGKPIYVFALKSELSEGRLRDVQSRDRVVLQNDDFILVDSGFKVAPPSPQESGKQAAEREAILRASGF